MLPTVLAASDLGSQGLQIAGAVCVLIAFAGVQLGRFHPASLRSLWLNLAGSGVLAVLAFNGRDLGFLLLEGVWFLVTLWGLLQRARGGGPQASAA